MRFELHHSIKDNEFRFTSGNAMSFPLHIHRSFEYFAQISGSTKICVDDHTYLLKAGEAVLVFPYQIHSYECVEDGEFHMCIFSPDIVAAYEKKVHHKRPKDNRFLFCSAIGAETDNIFLQKAIAYHICSAFDQGREYLSQEQGLDSGVLTGLLLFAEKHYCERCLLRDAAAKLGYDYAYLSKFFKRAVGISFKQYVNRLRVSDGIYLLSSTSKSVAEIAGLCGFECLRTFDREFRAVTGNSPSQYRKDYCQTL